MYAPKHFEETRLDVMHALIGEHPLGTLVTLGPDGLGADHIPFEVLPPSEAHPYGVLQGHVARGNKLWKLDSEVVLIVFQGPTAYISPSWYEEKRASGKVVPTYNYAAVHAHGRLRAIEDPQWLMAFLERLTNKHEAARPLPWKVTDAPREYTDQLLKAIVGIEIPIDRIQGKWKVSQNRPVQDQINIAEGLRTQAKGLQQQAKGEAMAALVHPAR
jgi:transcriptional regulator